MIKNITIKVRVDCRKDAYGVMDGTKEYVDTEPGKFFHVIISAAMSPDFNGKLRLEISHPRSGFHTYDIVNNPPKSILESLEPDDEMCFGSPGIRVSRLLGENYRVPVGQRDYVNVKLFLNNQEIENKDFVVRGCFS